MSEHKPARPITLVQQKHLDFIRQYIAQHDGVSPTLREIAKAMGRSLGATNDHVNVLKEKGWLTTQANAGRSIRLVDRCSECGRGGAPRQAAEPAELARLADDGGRA